jgi:hypothetical protein
METKSLTVKPAGFHKKEPGIAIICVKNIFLLHHLGWTENKCLEVQNVKK